MERRDEELWTAELGMGEESSPHTVFIVLIALVVFSIVVVGLTAWGIVALLS